MSIPELNLCSSFAKTRLHHDALDSSLTNITIEELERQNQEAMLLEWEKTQKAVQTKTKTKPRRAWGDVDHIRPHSYFMNASVKKPSESSSCSSTRQCSSVSSSASLSSSSAAASSFSSPSSSSSRAMHSSASFSQPYAWTSDLTPSSSKSLYQDSFLIKDASKDKVVQMSAAGRSSHELNSGPSRLFSVPRSSCTIRSPRNPILEGDTPPPHPNKSGFESYHRMMDDVFLRNPFYETSDLQQIEQSLAATLSPLSRSSSSSSSVVSSSLSPSSSSSSSFVSLTSSSSSLGTSSSSSSSSSSCSSCSSCSSLDSLSSSALFSPSCSASTTNRKRNTSHKQPRTYTTKALIRRDPILEGEDLSQLPLSVQRQFSSITQSAARKPNEQYLRYLDLLYNPRKKKTASTIKYDPSAAGQSSSRLTELETLDSARFAPGARPLRRTIAPPVAQEEKVSARALTPSTIRDFYSANPIFEPLSTEEQQSVEHAQRRHYNKVNDCSRDEMEPKPKRGDPRRNFSTVSIGFDSSSISLASSASSTSEACSFRDPVYYHDPVFDYIDSQGICPSKKEGIQDYRKERELYEKQLQDLLSQTRSVLDYHPRRKKL